MQLDETQQAVARWSPDDGNLRVVGGAGAGKTGTLATLVAKLVLIDEIPAEDICVMAYNRDAAKEISSRITKMIGSQHADQMPVGTFHSLGRRWLDRIYPKQWEMNRCTDLPRKSRAHGVPSTSMFWRHAVSFGSLPGSGRRTLGVSQEPHKYEQQVNLFRADCIKASDRPSSSLRFLADAWEMVEEAKRLLEVWDFNDVLESWLDVLRTRPEGWMRVVIVDEAQDNTRVRLEIARALAGTDGRMVLVGDLRQTIYLWAGAYPDLFRTADTTLNAKTLCLGYNYRSTPSIVALSNEYARNKAWLLGSEPEAFRSEDSPVLAPTGYETPSDMYSAWADEVLADHELSPNNTRAVLLRTNGMIAQCAAEFQVRNIPVVVQGSRPLLETHEGKTILDYVRAIWRHDLEAFSRILNQPNRFASRVYQNQLARQFLEAGQPVEQALMPAAQRCRVAPRTMRGLRAFARTMRQWRGMPWETAMHNIGSTIAQGWVDTGAAHETDSVAVLYAVTSLARRFEGPEEFLNFSDPDLRDEPFPMNPVVLSTIHRAKGREWDMVFVDVTEGSLPYETGHPRSVDEQQEEERLLYVAMTRAKTTLHLGYGGNLSPLCRSIWPESELPPEMPPDVDPHNGAEIEEMEPVVESRKYDFRL